MRILFGLMVALILTPLVELTLLMLMAQRLGIGWTLALVLGTGVAGSLLARSQGFRVWREIQQQMQAGRMPAQALIDGGMILFAGGLLLTPGVLTDALGMSLLIPFCRTFYRRALSAWFRRRIRVVPMGSPPTTPPNDVVDSYVVQPGPGEKRIE